MRPRPESSSALHTRGARISVLAALVAVCVGLTAWAPPEPSPPSAASNQFPAPTLAASPVSQPSTQPTSAPASDVPVIVIWQTPGNALNAPRGLVRAVWEDGTMLVATDPAKPGQQLMLGACDRAEVRALLAAIRDTTFFDSELGYAVPCGGFTSIYVKTERGLHRRWCGYFSDTDKDPAYHEFVRMWQKVRSAIDDIQPKALRAADASTAGSTFRGYSFAEPHKTPWIR